ncbi:hypothetical protein OG897_31705 [Streptomyces sp. NBC_00237]|uniref:hypothetical protein n=1 Tax=Streptomyces sp. NBC_00237 TaxID=2975687 RepID=UPI0022587E89|nr:hypothetical protein [Streptomyces sp. NBC_00237]MCX5205973.1 hypothetical protein [Streptomyces sp. NBC_00237]
MRKKTGDSGQNPSDTDTREKVQRNESTGRVRLFLSARVPSGREAAAEDGDDWNIVRGED